LFVQAERSLDRAQGGLGIGLTLVRSLVELHGGQISVSSAGAGKGSEFAVTLPLCAIEPTSMTTAPSRRTGPRGRPLHILIVDDNRDAAQSLAKVLELKGEKVLCTYDGLSAVELAATQRPDVILLDIGLPGIDGYQVAERLRRQRNAHQLKIIAVSGYGGELDQERARRAGFDHFLVKPVDFAALEVVLGYEAASMKT
jgi:two-component system, chemotaxis family, CheB/CheR fusion protein